MNKLRIVLKSGVSADGFDITVTGPENEELFHNSYSYGYNASYSKENAEHAHEQAYKSKKYNWERTYDEKPYTSDILVDLINKYQIENIEVVHGIYLFSGKEMSDEDITNFVDKYITPYVQLSELMRS